MANKPKWILCSSSPTRFIVACWFGLLDVGVSKNLSSKPNRNSLRKIGSSRMNIFRARRLTRADTNSSHGTCGKLHTRLQHSTYKRRPYKRRKENFITCDHNEIKCTRTKKKPRSINIFVRIFQTRKSRNPKRNFSFHVYVSSAIFSCSFFPCLFRGVKHSREVARDPLCVSYPGEKNFACSLEEKSLAHQHRVLHFWTNIYLFD